MYHFQIYKTKSESCYFQTNNTMIHLKKGKKKKQDK